MKKVLAIITTIALVVFLIYAVIYQKKEIPVEKPGKVVVTPAYEKYFGGAPSCDKGTAYAFVIYFPSSKELGKVVPFPFFTFDEQSTKKLAIQRLLGGMDVGSYEGEFIPFPSGSRLIEITDVPGTITVNFSKELDSAQVSVATALVLTLRQFQGGSDLRLLVGGKESALSAMIKGDDDSAIRQPSPPRLLSVTAMRDKGTKDIEELDASFDRPVEIRELKLFSRDGQELAGDMYHSVFDTTAVLKPKAPSQFKDRMPIKVRWKVVDKLGRQAEGDNVWFLELKEH